MKPVDQTIFGHGKGNCFTACVASLLELPIEDVPYFMGDCDWLSRFIDWCEARSVRVEFSTVFPSPKGEYVIVGGVSPRTGKGHACIALDGVIVHDPHVGDRRGLVGQWWDWINLSAQ